MISEEGCLLVLGNYVKVECVELIIVKVLD